MTTTPDHAPDRRPSPLWAVMVFTFVNSIGGGVVTTGFAFITESAYRFGPGGNYALGLLQGVAYIVGALGAGPVLSRLIARNRWVSERAVLGALMVALAALCALPWLAREWAAAGAGGAGEEGLASAMLQPASPWPIWLLIGGYSVLTGVLWPLVESFMSGGRTESQLRSATGLFNVVWSGAIVVAFLAMGPLVRGRPLEMVLGVAALHLACLALLPAFSRRPGAHPAHVGVAPESYRRLLGVFRIQLAATYLVYSALGPFLPLALDHVKVAPGWRAPAAATWLLARTLAFVVMQRWHGWHGSWRTAWVGITAVLAGFAGAVLSVAFVTPIDPALGLGGLLVGLAAFGAGMGAVYSAAIYYAMEVGHSEVDAGGAHEALIGLGYALGPACGLLALAAAKTTVSAEHPEPRGFEVLMVPLVATLAVVATVASFHRARRAASRGRLGD